MVIQCPRCSTRWRVADTAPFENPSFKCGRCHHLFREFPGAPEPEPERPRRDSPPRSAPQAEGDNLEFIFPKRAGEEDASPDDDGPVRGEDPDADPSPADEDEDGARADLGADAEPEPNLPGAFAPGSVLHVEEPMTTRSALGWTNRAMLGLIALHLALALAIRLAPDTARRWLGSLPLAGATIGRSESLLHRVHLQDVHGRYQRLGDTRTVFVVEGEAVNRSAARLERIQVEATIYGPSGAIDSKIVSGGNETALTDLSEAEVVLLQRLVPRLALAPGASTPFQAVFLEPPADLREISSRVLSVRPVRRASAPRDPAPFQG